MTDYLAVLEVLAMHADQIECYGGSHGIRDSWLLEAALYRPQTVRADRGSCQIGFPERLRFCRSAVPSQPIQLRQACPMAAQSREHFLMIAVQRRHFIGHHRKALQPRISE